MVTAPADVIVRVIGLFMILKLSAACTDAALWLANQRVSVDPPMADRAYGEHTRQHYDYYTSQTGETKALIAFFYGGGWSMGAKSQYGFVAAKFTEMGYDVAVVDYRLYPEYRYPDFVEDTRDAIVHLRDTYALPLFAIGHSAGAYNVMMAAARYTTQAQGLIGICGPYAFTPKIQKFRRIFEVAQEDWTQMHVTSHLHAGMPPTLLLHGGSDGLVDPQNTHALHDAIEGTASRKIIYPNMGHYRIMLPFANLSDSSVTEDINQFITEQLAATND